LNARPSLQQLLEVQEAFALPSPALVEKDWFVVRALAALAAADTGALKLVFGGGTALGRAYGLLQRMSEDIDLKIVSETTPSRAVLSAMRRNITEALLGAGFAFDPDNPAHRISARKGRYTKYALPYEPIAPGKGVLRPEIKIELTVFPMLRPPVERPVISFIAEGLGRAAELPAIACTAIVESAAEKFVALTRRAGMQFAGLEERDPTLVRHIHDLHVIREHYDVADAAALVRQIMVEDAKTYGAAFPAYRDDPLAETLRAVDSIAADAAFASGYATFQRDMVYGDKPAFATALATLTGLAGHLRG
jgi:predicted nucleotidyltransferase component of viral defense system